MKILIFCIAAVIVFALPLRAQEASELARELVAEGKKTLDKAWLANDKEEYLAALALFERALSAEPGNLAALYHRSFADYRFLIFVSRTDKETFKSLVGKAVSGAEVLMERKRDWSEALAMAAALYTMKIIENPMNAMSYGPKSDALLDEAIERDGANPRAYLLRGITKLNKPAFFGGGADKALPDFRKAAELFAKESASAEAGDKPAWGKLDVLAWLGICYERLEKPQEAMESYRQALAAEPNFAWVKNSLLPNLQKKTAAK